MVLKENIFDGVSAVIIVEVYTYIPGNNMNLWKIMYSISRGSLKGKQGHANGSKRLGDPEKCLGRVMTPLLNVIIAFIAAGRAKGLL